MKENKGGWQKNKAKEAKASGKAYMSQKTRRVQQAKDMKVSKILWYIINL